VIYNEIDIAVFLQVRLQALKTFDAADVPNKVCVWPVITKAFING